MYLAINMVRIKYSIMKNAPGNIIHGYATQSWMMYLSINMVRLKYSIMKNAPGNIIHGYANMFLSDECILPHSLKTAKVCGLNI